MHNKINDERKEEQRCYDVTVPVKTTRMLNDFRTLKIIHTNDVHGSVLEEETGEIGFSKVATFIEKNRLMSNNVLLLDAGDVFHGKVYTNLTKGKLILDIMNKIDYNAMVPGNHDFNYGFNELMKLKSEMKFVMLAANIREKGEKKPFLAFDIRNINGIKVGIFGLATPETYYKTNKKNIEGIEFQDPVKIAKKMVKKLSGKVDMIVALTHLGETGEFNSHDFAKKVPGIDIIIDGHSHDFLDKGKDVCNTLIAQTGASLKAVGLINLKVLNGRIVFKKAELVYKHNINNLEEDVIIKEIVDNQIERIRPKLEQSIGYTNVDLNGEREFARTSNTNLGVLIAKAFLGRSGADIAFLNGGGLRTSIKKGNITMGDVVNVLPFGNTLVEKDILGEDIKIAMEIAVGEYPEQMGGFPQIAGMKIKFNPSKEKGNRICSITVNGKELEKDKVYSIVMTCTTGDGGDDLYVFAKYPLKREYEPCDNIVVEYLKNHNIEDEDLSSNVEVIE